jgi:hypothetical protein
MASTLNSIKQLHHRGAENIEKKQIVESIHSLAKKVSAAGGAIA